jgi:glycosyltransferase involved in cell wall biosynthesis
MSPRRLRLMQLINTFSVGGAERHLFDLVCHLPKDRFDITVAFFKEEAEEARSLVVDFRSLGVEVVDLGLSHTWDPAAVWRLVRLVRQRRPDIVHTHLYRADVAGALVTGSQNVPLTISTVHNVDIDNSYRLFRRLILWAYKRADRVIAISEAVRSELCRKLGLPPERVVTIHYGLDANSWGSPLPSRRMANAPVIGTIGRLAHQKGQDLLLEAFASVVRQCPGSRLVLVGHDDEGLRPYLEQLARRLGLSEAVEFRGFADDVRPVLAQMDVFVLPSRWEGFGLVLLEAMAAARPVVATRVGPIPEIVVDQTTGYLVESGNRDALSRAIVKLIRQPQVARSMGQAGRRRVTDVFGSDRMARRTVRLYEDLAGRGGLRGSVSRSN